MKTVNWNKYAERYDYVASNNASYVSLLDEIVTDISKQELNNESIGIDLGGGTGNLTIKLAKSIRSSIILLDASHVMLSKAKEKILGENFGNVSLLNEEIQKVSYSAGSLDFVVAVHSIYAMEDPIKVIEKVHNWLKPNGVFYIVDYGKQNNALDWTKYFVINTFKKKGFLEAVKMLANISILYVQTIKIAISQKKGRYWTHTSEGLIDIVKDIGFETSKVKSVYRGYSTYLILKKR